MAWLCVKVSCRRLHRLSKPLRVLFFGTDKFSCDVLQSLWINRGQQPGTPAISQLDVICNSSKSAVYKFASANHMKLLKWPPDMDLHGIYDLGIVVSFGHMIPNDVIESFPYGILNLHPSLLPRWRGSSPIVYAILHGDRTTGVSIMQIQPHRFDKGPVLLQREYPIPHDYDTPRLADELSSLGSEMLLTVLEDLAKYKQHAVPQQNSHASYACKLKPDAANVDWQQLTMSDIRRLFNALHHKFDLRTEFHGHPIKLVMMSTTCSTPICHQLPTPGCVVYSDKDETLRVACKNGWVEFGRIVMRKPMSAKDFYNGYLSKIPADQHFFGSLHNPVLSAIIGKSRSSAD